MNSKHSAAGPKAPGAKEPELSWKSDLDSARRHVSRRIDGSSWAGTTRVIDRKDQHMSQGLDTQNQENNRELGWEVAQ